MPDRRPHTYTLYDPDSNDTEQLRSDLDALLTDLDVGWQSCSIPGTMVGIGGCLLTAMNRSLTNSCVLPGTLARDRRLYNMIGAMGFLIGPNLQGYPENAVWTQFMYHWNDAQTDVDVVKARVKDAINNL